MKKYLFIVLFLSLSLQAIELTMEGISTNQGLQSIHFLPNPLSLQIQNKTYTFIENKHTPLLATIKYERLAQKKSPFLDGIFYSFAQMGAITNMPSFGIYTPSTGYTLILGTGILKNITINNLYFQPKLQLQISNSLTPYQKATKKTLLYLHETTLSPQMQMGYKIGSIDFFLKAAYEQNLHNANRINLQNTNLKAPLFPTNNLALSVGVNYDL